ncbi:hypothetical protein [Paenibacillus sp. N3.4]|uniref:hypothetical protein n=1 Tax=Paenibacillus sp. N3.4 TaxID=2603222 RepID=UPI0011C703F4|nr:hypothetical protein [Paenibacillus sp. N3.4]TXK76919.1 hypothetical protein FU659_24385 [Paenibacillus sp. N3.4]
MKFHQKPFFTFHLIIQYLIFMIDGAREEGKLEGQIEIAKRLLAMGMNLDSIVKATAIPKDELKKWRVH